MYESIKLVSPQEFKKGGPADKKVSVLSSPTDPIPKRSTRTHPISEERRGGAEQDEETSEGKDVCCHPNLTLTLLGRREETGI